MPSDEFILSEIFGGSPLTKDASLPEDTSMGTALQSINSKHSCKPSSEREVETPNRQQGKGKGKSKAPSKTKSKKGSRDLSTGPSEKSKTIYKRQNVTGLLNPAVDLQFLWATAPVPQSKSAREGRTFMGDESSSFKEMGRSWRSNIQG